MTLSALWIALLLSGCAFAVPGHSGLPELSVNPSSLNFGNVATTSSGRQTVTLTNSGDTTVTTAQVIISGAGFSASGLTPNEPLTPSQSASLVVSFVPTATGTVSGSVTVDSNAEDSRIAVSLSGSGVQYGAHSVTLAWTASTSVIAGCNVYRGTTDGGPYGMEPNSGLVPDVTFTDTDVLSGLTYFYVVTGVDSEGVESVYSNQASATIPSP